MKPLQPGDLIAERFRVEALLGEGGIARVYMVRHVRLGSVHAVKILTLSRPSLADRLLLEGRIQAQLRHPNLVRVTDVVEHEGDPCLVMEYVAGSNLQTLLAEREFLPVEEALALFSGVLSAVSSAHDVGVLHRDLKPANILLEHGRHGLAPKVSDFGIAKVATEDRMREGTTNMGVQMGTPGYMAPEQVHDSARVDHRADIFALGAILYELLCGERPFVGDSTYSTLEATVHGHYQPLLERVADCPPHVAATIDRCLEPAMEDRFQSCHDLADALYAKHPALRSRIQRLEEAAVPAGLHTPEQTESTPRPGPASAPGAPGPAPGATLLPEIEAAAPPRQLGPASTPPPSPSRSGASAGLVSPAGIGASDPQELPVDGHAARVSPTAGSDAPASSLAGITIGGGADSAVLDGVEAPSSGRSLGLLAVLALGLLGAGAWWWTQQDGDELEVEELAAAEAGLGEAVELPDAPPAAEDAPAAQEAPAAGTRPPSMPAEAPADEAAAEQAAAEAAADEAAADEAAADEVAAEQAAAEAAAEQAAAEAAADEAAADEAAAEQAAAEQAAAEQAAAEQAAAEQAAAEQAAAEQAAAEQAAAEQAADGSADAAAEDAAAEAAAAEAPALEETAPEAPPKPAVRLAGTWQGEANGRPLTLELTDDGEGGVSGELRFTQGAIERVARVAGRFDPDSHRLSLSEMGGAGLQFTGVVRGTGMMGTYGRRGSGDLSWSATRQ